TLIVALLSGCSEARAGEAPVPLLKAEVEHSDVLPAVPAGLQPGQVYNGKTLDSQFQPKESWYKVPPWLAGSWHRENQIMVHSDGTTQQETSRYDARYGAQTDRTGQVWDRSLVPFRNSIDGGDVIDTQIVSAADRVITDGQR